MARVGIVGGLGPESTIDYYRRILAAWDKEDSSSAPAMVIDSVDVHGALGVQGKGGDALLVRFDA